MTDLFGMWVPDEWLDQIWAVMALAPHHTYQVLTKRPARLWQWFKSDPYERVLHVADQVIRPWFPKTTGIGISNPRRAAFYPHVWVGVSIESDRYVWRANILRQIPAAVRWVSAEPLLSGLPSLDLTGIDWLVTGGESGHKARPMHPDWVRDLRDRCQASGTAYFHKQWGEWAPTEIKPGGDLGGDLRRGHTVHLHAPGNPEGFFRKGDAYVSRVGRKAAGRLLDGREYSELPTVVVGAGV
jgi:protein gp37